MWKKHKSARKKLFPMNAGTQDKSPSKENATTLNTTTSNGSFGEASAESYYIDPLKERKMMRKFDVRDRRISFPLSSM
jgi:hypothetical protein